MAQITLSLWSRRQRLFLLLLLSLLFLALLCQFLARPARIPDPLLDAPRAAELDSRLDPNIAPWEQLALLPNLGQKRARAIVLFRDQFRSAHPGQLPFASAADLQQVSGIGPATVESLSPHLVFPPSPLSNDSASP